MRPPPTEEGRIISSISFSFELNFVKFEYSRIADYLFSSSVLQLFRFHIRTTFYTYDVIDLMCLFPMEKQIKCKLVGYSEEK